MVNYYTDIETYAYKEKELKYEPEVDTRKYAIGGICKDKGKTRYFKTAEEHKKYIYEEEEKQRKYKKEVTIYAHYSIYDFYAIFKKEILKGEWEIIRSEPLIAKHRTKKITFLDTYAIIRAKLELIGEMIGKQKLEMPREIKEIEEIKPYLERDIEIVKETIQEIKKIIGQIGTKPRRIWTAPQIAGNNFINWIINNKEEYYGATYWIYK